MAFLSVKRGYRGWGTGFLWGDTTLLSGIFGEDEFDLVGVSQYVNTKRIRGITNTNVFGNLFTVAQKWSIMVKAS